jgi:hypothetical protein
MLHTFIFVGKETSYSDTKFWFSYILFIIIIGGILVLFIYITRLASNEIFISSNKIHREVGRAKDLSASCIAWTVASFGYVLVPVITIMERFGSIWSILCEVSSAFFKFPFLICHNVTFLQIQSAAVSDIYIDSWIIFFPCVPLHMYVSEMCLK